MTHSHRRQDGRRTSVERTRADDPSRWLWRVAPLLIVGLVVMAYSETLSVPFHFDDVGALLESPYISDLRQAFRAVDQSTLAGRPLVTVTFALNYAWGGFDPTGYHVVNIALHALNAALVYFLVRMTLRWSPRWRWSGNRAGGFAFITALVWAIHPLQTEAVNYIVQRTELMMAACYLGTLYAAARSNWSPQPWGWQILATVCCFAGMLCKEVMVSAPLVVAAYDLTFSGDTFRRVMARRWPLYVALGTSWLLLVGMLLTGPRSKSVGFGLGMSAREYFVLQLEIVSNYLWLVVVPLNLCYDYGLGWAPDPRWVATGSVILLGLLVTIVWRWTHERWTALLALAFLAILAPSSSFVPIVTEVGAERRMYLPLLCVVIALLAAIGWLYRRATARAGANWWIIMICFLPVVVAMSALLFERTQQRNRLYNDTVALMRVTARQRPESARAYNMLGDALVKHGGPPELEESLVHYDRALELKPDDAATLHNRGIALSRLERYEEAAADMQRATTILPEFADAYSNLGYALNMLGRNDEADDAYRKSIEVSPKNGRLHSNYGSFLIRVGRLVEAERMLRRAVELNPTLVESMIDLGGLQINLGQVSEGLGTIRRAAAIDPDNDLAWSVLASQLISLGQLADAQQAVRMALEINPHNSEALNSWGVILTQQGNTAEATRILRLSIEANPANTDAQMNLAKILAEERSYSEALHHAREAVRYNPGHPGAQPLYQELLRLQHNR